MTACELCETRRARRACPGIRGQICAVCCGTEREVSVNCPLDCEYLQEARRHERSPEPDPAKLPSSDITLSEEFLQRNGRLVGFMAATLVEAALQVPGVVDSDVREALDSLVRTYRTLESGLYYETLPTNPLAGVVHQHMRRRLQEVGQAIRQTSGVTAFRDVDVLGSLVFLQRMGYLHDNGRRRGRAFIDFLRAHAPQQNASGEPASRLVLP